jgi:hypothetical protein
MPWNGLVRSSRHSLFLTVAVLVASLTCLGTARGAQPQSASFSLRGSNGFVLDVTSEGGEVTVIASERRPPVATFTASGRPRSAATGNGASSVYTAPPKSAGPGTVDAGLGALGRIAVQFRPSGRRIVSTARRVCGRPLRIVRRLGTFVGTIRFEGEAGYTAVAAASARGSVGTPLPSDCGAPGSSPGAAVVSSPSTLLRPLARGAVLFAEDPRRGSRFRAAPAAGGVSFRARVEERNDDGVTVVRRAQAGAPTSAFDFDPALSWAAVRPPAPFSGTARFAARAGTHWTGSLRVTFPGLSVPLTGAGFRARLGRS